MATNLKECPICRNIDVEETVLQNYDASRWDCPRCGTFEASKPTLSGNNFEKNRHFVSAWIRQQNKAGIKYPLVGGSHDGNSSWFLNLRNMGFPISIIEKLDTLIKAYSDIITNKYNNKYQATIKTESYPFLISEIAGQNSDEIIGLNKILSELDYIETAHEHNHVKVKAKGWLYISDLKKPSNSNDNAFLAMWFNSCTEEYRNAVRYAVEHCGYKLNIVDQHEFNGFIMDQIISLIRNSRFLIADFTCRPEVNENETISGGVRGGVYWEAGLAYGMDKPVIHTCEDSMESKRRIHFDLEQYKTFFWKTDELKLQIRNLSESITDPNFTEKLALHIIATIGKGNYTE